MTYREKNENEIGFVFCVVSVVSSVTGLCYLFISKGTSLQKSVAEAALERFRGC